MFDDGKMELKDGLDLLFLFLFYVVIIAKERTFTPAHKAFLFLSLSSPLLSLSQGHLVLTQKLLRKCFISFDIAAGLAA